MLTPTEEARQWIQIVLKCSSRRRVTFMCAECSDHWGRLAQQHLSARTDVVHKLNEEALSSIGELDLQIRLLNVWLFDGGIC